MSIVRQVGAAGPAGAVQHAAVEVLVGRIVRAMVVNAPLGCPEQRMVVSATALHARFVTEARRPGAAWVRYSAHVGQAADELRVVCYVPGRGAWFVLRVEVAGDGRRVVYELDYDGEPGEGLLGRPANYVHDLMEFHPRSPEHRPAWLRESIDQSYKIGARNAVSRARRVVKRVAAQAERAEPGSGAGVVVDLVVQRLGAGLVAAAPVGWREIFYTLAATNTQARYSLEALMPDGSRQQFVAPDREVVEAGEDLRAVSYVSQRGTWWVARVRVVAGGAPTWEADFEGPPPEHLMFDPLVYARDVWFYPRDGAHRAPWLVAALVASDEQGMVEADERAREMAEQVLSSTKESR